MGEIWFGWNIIVGMVVVIVLEITFGLRLARPLWQKVRAKRLSARLVDAGFTWEYKLQGWLSRDPYNNDWILWDERNERMLRRPDQERAGWRQAEESLRECIDLGRKYRVQTGIFSHGQI